MQGISWLCEALLARDELLYSVESARESTPLASYVTLEQNAVCDLPHTVHRDQ
jgi:hypothetical protein